MSISHPSRRGLRAAFVASATAGFLGLSLAPSALAEKATVSETPDCHTISRPIKADEGLLRVEECHLVLDTEGVTAKAAQVVIPAGKKLTIVGNGSFEVNKDKAAPRGAGIEVAANGTFELKSGTVSAWGSSRSPGVGASRFISGGRDTGTVEVSGTGNLTAFGGQGYSGWGGGAGIGGGYGSDGGIFRASGHAKVTAIGGTNEDGREGGAAGIGGGFAGNGVKAVVTDSAEVTAMGGEANIGGAGIGGGGTIGGGAGAAGEVEVSGSASVTATNGGYSAASVGGGGNADAPGAVGADGGAVTVGVGATVTAIKSGIGSAVGPGYSFSLPSGGKPGKFGKLTVAGTLVIEGKGDKTAVVNVNSRNGDTGVNIVIETGGKLASASGAEAIVLDGKGKVKVRNHGEIIGQVGPFIHFVR